MVSFNFDFRRCRTLCRPVRSIARPGETISSGRYESRVGGKGANQAIAITRAGGHADFYGTVGHDGLWVRKKVASFGLDDSKILVTDVRFLLLVYNLGCPSGIYFRFLQVELSYNSRILEKIV